RERAAHLMGCFFCCVFLVESIRRIGEWRFTENGNMAGCRAHEDEGRKSYNNLGEFVISEVEGTEVISKDEASGESRLFATFFRFKRRGQYVRTGGFYKRYFSFYLRKSTFHLRN
ncbi:hypothetical protein RKD55_004410, partial [Rossellomorea marisflavi]